MKFYDENKPLYIKMDVAGVGLGALPQTRSNISCLRDEVMNNGILSPIAFSNRCLTGPEQRYSNIEREALGILYDLEKFHHYCFVREDKV